MAFSILTQIPGFPNPFFGEPPTKNCKFGDLSNRTKFLTDLVGVLKAVLTSSLALFHLCGQPIPDVQHPDLMVLHQKAVLLVTTRRFAL